MYKRQVATLAIVTNGFEKVQSRRVAESGIGAYLEDVFVSEKLDSEKPSRRIFDSALRALGVENREHVLVVGDRDVYKRQLLTETADAGTDYLNDTLFLGDSNTVRLYNNGLISLQQFCAKEGIGTQVALNEGIVTFKKDSSHYTIPQAVSYTHLDVYKRQEHDDQRGEEHLVAAAGDLQEDAQGRHCLLYTSS